MIGTESNGMDGNAAAAKRRDRGAIDPATVIGAVAHQQNRADGKVGGFVNEIPQAIADMGCGSDGLNLREV